MSKPDGENYPPYLDLLRDFLSGRYLTDQEQLLFTVESKVIIDTLEMMALISIGGKLILDGSVVLGVTAISMAVKRVVETTPNVKTSDLMRGI